MKTTQENVNNLMDYYKTLTPDEVLSILRSVIELLPDSDIAEEVFELGLE